MNDPGNTGTLSETPERETEDRTEAFTRLVSPGVTADGRMFVRIKYDGSSLSITGVTGPLRSGNAKGSCGQCRDNLLAIHKLDAGWTRSSVARLYRVWRDWHLNDMRSGTPWQMEWMREREHPSHTSSWLLDNVPPDPESGYRWGSAWLSEPVPEAELAWLAQHKNTEHSCAWGDF